MLVLLNKPFGVLSQFTDPEGRATLSDYVDLPGIYPAGRLDRDSEGLLLLTDEGALQHRVAHPERGMHKTYVAQVEGIASPQHLQRLTSGVGLSDGPARAVSVKLLARKPGWLWPRDPPVRVRKRVPDCWLQITLDEGRNRQVRRMTAAVGLPTLRLIRTRIGPWKLDGLKPGSWRLGEPPVQNYV